MRTLSRGFLACAVSVLAPDLVLGQLQPPPQIEGPATRMRPQEAAGLSEILVPRRPPAVELDREAAGFARDSRPDLLTWERVYTLALVRARGGHRPLAETLDPKALDEQAARLGVADFVRFREEFLAAKPGAVEGFRDPSGDFLEILRRLQTIDYARRNLTFHESMLALIKELSQGQAGGLSQLDVALLEAALTRARQNLSEEITGFRDRLEELKVALGLSPHAPVIPDRERLAAFSRVPDAVEEWQRRSDRQLQELPRIVQKLPALRTVVFDGRSILEQMGGTRDQQEVMLASAVRLAIRNRPGVNKGQAPGDADAAIELNVRRRIRHLYDLSRTYNGEQ